MLAGNPGAPGPYVIRVRFAPGTMSPPHFHPEERQVVVLKGTWWVGSGPRWDRDATTPLPAGSFAVHHAGKIHYDGEGRRGRRADLRHRAERDEGGRRVGKSEVTMRPPQRYDSTSPWISRVQPSSITNSSSLNGSEIVVGEIIDMPSASRMVATIRSTTTNTM